MSLTRRPMRRKPKRHPVPEGVRDTVYRREGGRCARCGLTLGAIWELQHRKPRGMGGSADPAIHLPSNLLALCTRCHHWATGHPVAGIMLGVNLWQSADPSQVPVTLYTGRSVLLTDDYRYEEVADG